MTTPDHPHRERACAVECACGHLCSEHSAEGCAGLLLFRDFCPCELAQAARSVRSRRVARADKNRDRQRRKWATVPYYFGIKR